MALEETVLLQTEQSRLLTESINNEVSRITDAANQAVATINTAMDVKIVGVASIYVDLVAGDDANPGTAAQPVKTLVFALKNFSKYNLKMRIYLQSGQDHLLDDVVFSYSDELRFIPWNGGADSPFAMNSAGATRAEIKAAWPSIVSVGPLAVNQNGAILSDTAMQTAYWFYNMVIETAPIPVGAEANIWNGFFYRRGVFDSDKTVMASTCLFVINSPFIHLTAGVGLLNFSSYYSVFDVSGLTSGNFVSDRLIVNEGGKPISLYMIGSAVIGLPAGQIFESKLLSNRHYSSAVQEESPYNISSNLNLSRAAAPLL